MSQTRLSALIGFGTLAVIVVAVAVWQLNPFRDRLPWVPTCSDLTAPMPKAAGGAWSVSKQDSARKVAQASTLCELAFTSADQRFSGTVSVRISGAADNDKARQEAQTGECPGSPWPAAVPSGYAALRACNAVIGQRISSSVRAAKGNRSLHLNLLTSIPAGAPAEDAAAFAQATLGKLADLALSLPESK